MLILTDDAIINCKDLTVEPDGPYMIAPTLNLVTQPSEGGTGSAVVLTSKNRSGSGSSKFARTQASSQYAALEEAIDSTTDLEVSICFGKWDIK